jgi:hypothetical protein
MRDNKRPGPPGRGGHASPDRSGGARGGKPQRNPQPRIDSEPGRTRQPSERHAPPSKSRNDRRPGQPQPSKRIDLPMAAGGTKVPEAAIDGVVYIAYGEMGDDVAFELSEDLQEAIEIVAQMREDGFGAKLFQAHEIDIVVED